MIKGLLKKLFILLLIGLPILFVNISSATYSAHTIGAFNGNAFQVSVLEKGKVVTINNSTTKNVFAPANNVLFFWDTLSNPRLIALDTDGWSATCKNRSEYVYYYICDEIPDSGFTTMTNCVKETINSSYLGNFMYSIKSYDNWAYEFSMLYNNYYEFNLCFSSKSKGNSLCFKYKGNQGANHWCYLGGDMTGDILDYNFSSLPTNIVGNPPTGVFVPDPGNPISSGYNITNSGVIASFNQLGYDRAICYGGVSSGTYNRLVGRTGMNLFEIYDLYNPLNLNLHDWYDYYRNGYIDNPTVTSDTGSVFIIDGVFRMPLFGLFGFGYEYVQLFPTDDILQYCDILLNRDPNAYYTGDDKEDIIGFVIRSGKYTLSGARRQTYKGPLSMLSGSDREMSYRDFFNNISNNFANSFDDIPMNIVGVVPKYILMFMFALIFIRMISK